LPILAAIVRTEQLVPREIKASMRMRANNERRIPVITLRFDVLALDRCDRSPLAGFLVKANKPAILALGINDIRVGGIGVRGKPAPSIGRVPVRVDDARRAACFYRSAERVIVLQTAVNVIERQVIIDRNVIELSDRQVLLEDPVLPAVIAFVDT